MICSLASSERPAQEITFAVAVGGHNRFYAVDYVPSRPSVET